MTTKRTPTTKRTESSPSAADARSKTPAATDHDRALDALTRHLALRDHSLPELRAKLGRRFDPELVERLLKEAGEKGWLTPEDEIAERLALSLARRHKSQMYIEGQLRRRGLPTVAVDAESELAGIRHLLARKFGPGELSFAEKDKAYRFLKYRGFKESAIRQVLNEKRES